MESIEYAIAYSEVLEILKHIPLRDYNKIPEDKIKIFKGNAKKDRLEVVIISLLLYNKKN